jgi:hypothetical protein
MKRRLFVLALILLGPAEFLYGQERTEQDIIDWRSKPQWNEKSLREEAVDKPVFREFLVTPFWGQALARMTVNPDGSGELVTKVCDDRESGNKLVSKTRHLTPAEVSSFLALVKQAEFWALPRNEVTPSPPHALIRDADVCILEGMDRQTYHAVRRAILRTQTPITNACSFFTRPALVEAVRSPHSQ